MLVVHILIAATLTAILAILGIIHTASSHAGLPVVAGVLAVGGGVLLHTAYGTQTVSAGLITVGIILTLINAVSL